MARNRRTRSMALSEEQFQRLASTICSDHAGRIERGYRITGTRRIWERRDGSWTARFVYRKDGVSIVETIKGLRFG